VEENVYTQHVLCGTRDGAILDLILTSVPDLVSNVKILESLGKVTIT
jgi:hypothetical protein